MKPVIAVTIGDSNGIGSLKKGEYLLVRDNSTKLLKVVLPQRMDERIEAWKSADYEEHL